MLSTGRLQVISDPSTADLVAAAMQPDEAVVRMAEEPPANVMVVEPDETSDVKGIEADVTAVLPGGAGRVERGTGRIYVQ